MSPFDTLPAARKQIWKYIAALSTCAVQKYQYSLCREVGARSSPRDRTHPPADASLFTHGNYIVDLHQTTYSSTYSYIELERSLALNEGLSKSVRVYDSLEDLEGEAVLKVSLANYLVIPICQY